ncbi:MAG: peptidoglycan D,D-transpeptidase FtsI family protein, partial [Lachnospiraceae bacterium]
MYRNKTAYRKKILVFMSVVILVMAFLVGRLVYLMVFCSEYYGQKAEDLHERERDIKAARGKILDRNGVVLAENKTVCTISVIHSQIEEPEKVISVLAKELEMDEAEVKKRVEKVSSIERIKTNVSKEVGDAIRAYGLSGVKIDEDYKRYYPYDSLASKVLGFTGGDNQGIIGLEVKYDKYLQGENGKILTLTDARGVEIENAGERRMEPVDGDDLHISLDYNIQKYVEQAAKKALEEHEAESVSVLMMNPQNGEILAMVNVPEFNLNEPFTIDGKAETNQDKLNLMWRNGCINDTYEPGSTFKIITSAAAFEEGVVTEKDQFNCPGYKIVEDRKIRCSKVGGHGTQDFAQGLMNSCNPVFIELGLRLGSEKYYSYFKKFGLLQKTNVDLPGEAATIMHNPKNIGQVELATIAFGQSFQITPIQLATTVSSIINGGTRVTPHFGVCVTDSKGKKV